MHRSSTVWGIVFTREQGPLNVLSPVNPPFYRHLWITHRNHLTYPEFDARFPEVIH